MENGEKNKGIKEKSEKSKQYMLKTVEQHGEKIVDLTSDNVARVEAMIQNDSAYIRAFDKHAGPERYQRKQTEEFKYGGSTAYWVMQLKEVLIIERLYVENKSKEESKMKKVFMLMIVSLLMASLTACGRNNETISHTEATNNQNNSEVTVSNASDNLVNNNESHTAKINLAEKEIVDSGACGDNVQWALTKDNILYVYGSGAMYDCSSVPEWYEHLKGGRYELVIENGVSTVGEKAFWGCQLFEISLPDTVTSIGLGSFAKNYLLTTVEIPNGCESIGDNAFEECTNLEAVIFNEGLKTIGKRAFEKCKKITSLKFPNSLISIGEDSFRNSMVESLVFNDGLITIERNAFSYCENLKSIILPDSVLSVGKEAFVNCTSVTTLKLSNKMLIIEDNSFRGLSITQLEVPDSVTSIGESAFSDCYSLEEAVLGSNVESIGDYAFCECKSLGKINLRDGIKIGKDAFWHCSNLSN